jgi:hypothetical protein
MQRKVIFDKVKNAFTSSCAEQLLSIAVPESSGIYFSPPPVSEIIYSNLLKLNILPKFIFAADTKYRKRGELWRDLLDLEYRKGINKSWILQDTKIYSFYDLTKMPWLKFVTIDTVRQFYTDDWAKSGAIDHKRNFVELLNKTFENIAF